MFLPQRGRGSSLMWLPTLAGLLPATPSPTNRGVAVLEVYSAGIELVKYPPATGYKAVYNG